MGISSPTCENCTVQDSVEAVETFVIDVITLSVIIAGLVYFITHTDPNRALRHPPMFSVVVYYLCLPSPSSTASTTVVPHVYVRN